MKIVCISDTHNHDITDHIPNGDVLIHAGDLTNTGSVREFAVFNKWFTDLPHPHKILAAGNHDFIFERSLAVAASMLAENVHYLQDSGIVIDGIHFWGTPWTPEFNDWAFNLDAAHRHDKFEHIPTTVDVLVSHGPAWGYGDQIEGATEHLGCQELRKIIGKIHPAYHVYGHIHSGYGIWAEDVQTIGVNASICDEKYRPQNQPIVVWI